MRGPYEDGNCVNPMPPSEWSWEKRNLVRGNRYRVIKPFVDADGDTHAAGEEWVFLSAMFSKFDDLLTLCIRRVSGGEWTVPLYWKEGKQIEIVQNFQTYVTQA